MVPGSITALSRFCWEAGRGGGFLLWNVWGQVDAARRLIEAADLFEPGDLRGRLPA